MEESKDPCKDITCKVDSQMLRKDVLSPEEVQKLMACHYDNENPTVRQAFIFCLYCGLRFCNVKDLTFKNVDYANRLLKFEQSKAKEHSASSGVVIPLNDGLLSIIGEAPTDKNCLIFDLSTYESCCKESWDRQTYKLAPCSAFVCREHFEQWGKYQNRSQPFRA